MLLFLTFLSMAFCVSQTAHLPNYFNICNLNNNFKQCVLDNIKKNQVNIVNNGDKSLKLPSLNPMKIKKINIQATESLKVELSDLEFRGIDTCIVTDISLEPDNELFDLIYTCEYSEMIGNYNLDGKIMILPIKGSGKLNVTLVKPAIDYKTKLEVVERDGEKYYNIVPTQIVNKPVRAYYQLDNLFNGDKRLGDEMNIFLNENWKDVLVELGPGINSVIQIISKAVSNAFLTNIPISELYTT